MPTREIAGYLLKTFGLGMQPLVSRRLYSRLQREAEEHGEPVLRIISECATASDCARKDRGSWFRAAVSRRLKENGFLQSSSERELRAQVQGQLDNLAARLAAKQAVQGGL